MVLICFPPTTQPWYPVAKSWPTSTSPSFPQTPIRLRVTCGTNSAELPFTVFAGGEPKLDDQNHSCPARLATTPLPPSTWNTPNTGDVAMPAPVLEVGAAQNGRHAAILTLDSSRLVQGFWTAAMPEGFANSVQFLASGDNSRPAPTRRIRPRAGLLRRLAAAVGFQLPANLLQPRRPRRRTTRTSSTGRRSRTTCAPAASPPKHGNRSSGNLAAQTGATWGDYVRMLNDNARYLAELGETVTDIRDLLSFEVMQAIRPEPHAHAGQRGRRPGAGAGIAHHLHAQLQHGHPVALRAGPVRSRLVGQLGYVRSPMPPDGTVTILGPGGSRRVFQPDSRDCLHYFAAAGDYATLTALGGGVFTLRESDGTLYAFRADGKLDSVAGHPQQPHHLHLQRRSADAPDALRRTVAGPDLQRRRACLRSRIPWAGKPSSPTTRAVSICNPLQTIAA